MNTQIIYLISSFIFTAISGKFIIPILKKLKIGQSERDDGPRSHLRKQGTPTMGGIIIMFGMIVGVILACISLNKTGDYNVAKNLLPLLCLTIGFGLIGFVDDFIKLVLNLNNFRLIMNEFCLYYYMCMLLCNR